MGPKGVSKYVDDLEEPGDYFREAALLLSHFLCPDQKKSTIWLHYIWKHSLPLHNGNAKQINMNWNVCNFIPPSYCPFFFFFVAETKFPPALGLLPRSMGRRARGFICWECHVSWWWLSLSFSGSSDTNQDASAQTAFLHCSLHLCRSINPFCNFISISPALAHLASPPPPPSPYRLLRAWHRPFINMNSERGYLKTVFRIHWLQPREAYVTCLWSLDL